VSRVKLMVAAAMKAKQAWDRVPPEKRRQLLDQATATLKTHGPAVAKKAAKTARVQGPAVARRLAEALEKARKR